MAKLMNRTHHSAAPLHRHRSGKHELREQPKARPEIGVRPHALSGLSPARILGLQRTIGNQAVQRLLVQRAPNKSDEAKAKETGGLGSCQPRDRGRK